ncbi:MAG: Uma2 family endonuclease [Planctomycetes bacterium]|nr:Uma2 family endonuclease [Planctomycetota bacterium]
MTDGKAIAPTRELPYFAEWEEPLSGLQGRESKQVEDVLRRHFDLGANEATREEPVCYDRRDLRHAITPDVFVVLGVPSRIRERYLPWTEGKPPDWALEVASSSTAERDRTDKLTVYHALGVREVFLFDPTGEFHPQVLAGYSWAPEGYQPIEPEGERFSSEKLGLLLEAESYREDKVLYYRLRFVDPTTGERLPTTEEIAKSTREALEENAQALRQKDQALRQKDQALRQKDQALVQNAQALRQKDQALAEKERLIQDLRRKLGEV